MKILLIGLFAAIAAFAQNPGPVYQTTTAPSGSCGQNTAQLVGPGGLIYTCQNGTWAQISGSGGGTHNFGAVFSGVSVAPGSVAYFPLPSACTIQAWNFQVDTGTATVKVWKIAAGTAIPTSSNSINTSGVSISIGTSIRSTTLSDFTTTTVTAHDIGAITITAVSGGTTFLNFTVECQ